MPAVVSLHDICMGNQSNPNLTRRARLCTVWLQLTPFCVLMQAMSAFPSLAGLLVPAGEGSGAASAGGPAADPKDLEDIEKLANDYFQVYLLRTCQRYCTGTQLSNS